MWDFLGAVVYFIPVVTTLIFGRLIVDEIKSNNYNEVGFWIFLTFIWVVLTLFIMAVFALFACGIDPSCIVD